MCSLLINVNAIKLEERDLIIKMKLKGSSNSESIACISMVFHGYLKKRDKLEMTVNPIFLSKNIVMYNFFRKTY